MADRDKVIKELEECLAASCRGFRPRLTCPYNDDEWDIMRDALELLKEQKAKVGAWQWKIHGKPENGGTLGEAVCNQCGKSTYATAVKGDLNYCPNCGAKMEGR